MNIEKSILDNEGSMAQSPSQLVGIMILNRLELLGWAIANYESTKTGTGEKINSSLKVKGQANTLISILSPRWKKENKEGYEKAKREVKNEEFITLLETINEYLHDNLRLTKIDNLKKYEPLDIIKRNQIKMGY